MIDPIHSLAFSMQSNRGVFAVLLGSGISRAAKIPTGWEITIDLVRKLAAVYGESCEPTPETWYESKFGKPLSYSDVVDALAKSPTERQQLLRGYIEPADTDSEESSGKPTKAHRAIAALVSQGFIKVIITTNFDRLMESALNEVGVVPTVISTSDQVLGALPLIHTNCLLFKVHGDYLDTRISNTPTELATYSPQFDKLLDRIFDEFGLIVCGWSAEWDEALRHSLMRAPSRRFSTYWTTQGELTDHAKALVAQRGASVIRIVDADGFFNSVYESIQSLSEFSRPHPLSVDIAVASLKRFLSESRYRIQFADLVGEETDRVVNSITADLFINQNSSAPTNSTATDRVRNYEASCATLMAMAPIGGFWAEEQQYYVWENSLSRLVSTRPEARFKLWAELCLYPATILLYALGLGALEANHLRFLSRLFTVRVSSDRHEEVAAIQILPPFSLFSDGGQAARFLTGMERRYAPLNDWLFELLRKPTQRVIPVDARYTYIFDKLEILMALGYSYSAKRTKEWYWAPPGAFGYRSETRARILKELSESISNEGERSAFVSSGIFGSSAAECTVNLNNFKEFTEQVVRSWMF